MKTAQSMSDELEPFRSYLRLLAESQLPAALRGKVDASDIVQQTMLQAHQAREQFRGSNDAQRGAWLRTILANVLWGMLRHYGRESRDLSREQSLAGIEFSSVRLEALLAADTSSPSQNMHRVELAAQLAGALMELGEEQRQVILLKYWHDRSLGEIAAEIGKSPEATAGLLYRGLRHLRSRSQIV